MKKTPRRPRVGEPKANKDRPSGPAGLSPAARRALYIPNSSIIYTGSRRKIPQGSSELKEHAARALGLSALCHLASQAHGDELRLTVKTARQKLFSVKSSVFLQLFKSTSFCRARRRSGLETFQQGWRKILTSTTRALALSSLLLHPCGPCSRRFEGRALLLQRSACSPHAVLVPAQEHLAQ